MFLFMKYIFDKGMSTVYFTGGSGLNNFNSFSEIVWWLFLNIHLIYRKVVLHLSIEC
jgi:hypothetical protein